MKKQYLWQILAVITALLTASSASAVNVVNITQRDPNTGSWLWGTTYYGEQSTGWYKGSDLLQSGPASEFQEVEPGMQTGAAWDLAAFTANGLNNGTLGVLSGYDLQNGFENTTIGDIFVDTDGIGKVRFPDPNGNYDPTIVNGSTASDFDFEYAIRFDFANSLYKVYALDEYTVLQNASYFTENYNSASNPVRVSGTPASAFYTDTLVYNPNFNPATLWGLNITPTSAYKYYAELQGMNNWLRLGNDDKAWFQLTMSCGNDAISGQKTGSFIITPDGGATVSLLGMSLLAILGASAVKRRKIIG